MAQFDVYRVADGYALDCQTDLMNDYSTRFTVPLRRPNDSPQLARRLNPVFMVDGEEVAMLTQYAGAMPVAALNRKVASLADYDLEIKSALDMLISGF